ncbi:hypothetical protein CLOM_g20543 [Closterium sp. NIES-68]|nr:hypothetical protein CLOM_g20543 [Closterium sp. NIES-68]
MPRFFLSPTRAIGRLRAEVLARSFPPVLRLRLLPLVPPPRPRAVAALSFACGKFPSWPGDQELVGLGDAGKEGMGSFHGGVRETQTAE